MEISIINKDGEVIFDKKIRRYKGYIEELKNKVPDEDKMRKMEYKFLDLVKKDKMVASYYKIGTGVGLSILTNSTYVYADTLGGFSNKLKVIVSPITELLAGLGYPVTYMMIITGFIMIIMGKKSKGLEVIKWACIGYIGLQFVPFLLGLLEMIGVELRKSL